MSPSEALPPPPLRKRGRSLRDVAACRRALAAYIHMLEAAQIDPKIANSIFYGISLLIGSFRDDQLAAIETQLEELRRSGVIK